MKQPDRICISRIKYIGDIVLTTPIIRAVREQFPRAHIAYLGEKEAVSLLENNPFLNEVIPFDFSRPTLLEQPRVMWKIHRSKFDVFVDLFCNPRTALLAYSSGARMRIGKVVKGRGNLYTHQIQDDGKPKPAIAFHYQYVEPLGVKPAHWKTEIFLGEEEKQAARNLLTQYGINARMSIVGLHPGATWPAKMWPADRFAELALRIGGEDKVQVIFTQGLKDRSLLDSIAQHVTGKAVILPPMPLRKLAAVLSQMNVYVSNDCGPMHIAVAVGTKTIGIFGPGEDDIWFPYLPPHYDATDGHVALRKNVACHPCHLDFCNRTGNGFMECLKLLTVDEVLAEVKKRIG